MTTGTKRKLTFDDALDRINEERNVSQDDVQAKALRRVIWSYYSCFPGCLPEYQGVTTSKESAIDSIAYVVGADDEMTPGKHGPSRGWKTSLRRHHIFYDGRMHYVIKKLNLVDAMDS